MDISLFGLGKVGTTLGACLAAGGARVIGFDVEPVAVEAFATSGSNTEEPGVAERLKAGAVRISATSDAAEAVRASSLSFVIVPTPSNALGGFSNAYVLDASRQIGAAIAEKEGPHTVAVVSTMLPGSSAQSVIPALEKASGRRIGDGLGYAYNPAFIALGEVVRGFETPDFVLIGQADEASGDVVAQASRLMLKQEDTPIARMAPIEAEIAKIASNTHETMRVAFANMLLGVCSELPGANVDRITEALTYRMGRRFFRGATPYGGPCWPRDNLALAAFMDTIGAPSTLPRSVDRSNGEHGSYLLRKILNAAPRGASVGIAGLAYKPGTSLTEHAFGVELAASLAREGRKVSVWDPLAMPGARAALGDLVGYADGLEALLRGNQVVVLAIPLPDFAGADWRSTAKATVIDCWRCLRPEQAAAVGAYAPLGQGPHSDLKDWIETTLGTRFGVLTN